MMGNGYMTRGHSVCCLTYHAVFVTKYRRKAISDGILLCMKDYAGYLITEKYGGRLIGFNGESDHVHILFELPPSATPSVVICSLKTQLSKRVRSRYYDEIKDKLWKDSFWSDSYFLSTSGGANIETLEKYIKDQGIEKPKRKYVRKKK